MSREPKFFVQEQHLPWESWGDWGQDPDSEVARRNQIQWKTLVSSDRTDSQGLAAGVALLEPGRELSIHHHAQDEIYYILSGYPTVTVAGRARVVRPGTTVFIPGGVKHGVRNDGEGSVRLFYVLQADAFGDVVYRF
mgnify:CR=1 FL=1